MKRDNKQCMTFTFQNKCFFFRFETTLLCRLKWRDGCIVVFVVIVVVVICMRGHILQTYKRKKKHNLIRCVRTFALFYVLLLLFSFCPFLKIDRTWCFPHRPQNSHFDSITFRLMSICARVRKIRTKIVQRTLIFIHILFRSNYDWMTQINVTRRFCCFFGLLSNFHSSSVLFASNERNQLHKFACTWSGSMI